MIKIKNILCFIMIVTLLFSTSGLFYNEVKAVKHYAIDKATLYSKGELFYFSYKGERTDIQFVVYEKDGVEYPAYSLNRELLGVDIFGGIVATVNKGIENMEVWRAITNGYPYKTLTELGCNTEEEAFAATKVAVYSVLYSYNWSDFEPVNEAGQRVIAAAKRISEIAKSSQETKVAAKVEIEKVSSNWKEDAKLKGYISRTYRITTNAECVKYTVKLEHVSHMNGIMITDTNNVEKTQFDSDEEFKILIPISEVESKSDVKPEVCIETIATLRTFPILYGETQESHFQNYALATGEAEYISASITDYYPINKTKIRIIKADAESGKKLINAKFNILDKNGRIIYADVTTNEYGIAEINGIIPGTYYIEEVQSPNGYTKYDERVEIEIKYNETYTINMNNYQKPETEDKEVEEESQIDVTGKKEEKLPVTGF